MAAIRILLKGNEIDRRELGDSVVIGRGVECDLQLTGGDVSRTHCRIERAEGKYLLIDLNSRNGTLVGGVRASRHQLGDGDVLQVGDYVLQFVSGSTTRQKLDEKVKDLVKVEKEHPPTSLAAIIAEAGAEAAAKSNAARAQRPSLLARLTSKAPVRTTAAKADDESRPWYRHAVSWPMAIALAVIAAIGLYVLTSGVSLPHSAPPPQKALPHSNPLNND